MKWRSLFIIVLLFVIKDCIGQHIVNFPGLITYDYKIINPAFLCPEKSLSLKLISLNEINKMDDYHYSFNNLSIEKPFPKIKSFIAFSLGTMFENFYFVEGAHFICSQICSNILYNYNPVKGFYTGLSISLFNQKATLNESILYGYTKVTNKKIWVPDLSIGVQYENSGFQIGFSGKNLLLSEKNREYLNNVHGPSFRAFILSASYQYKWDKIKNKFFFSILLSPSHIEYQYFLLQNILSYKNIVDFGINTNFFSRSLQIENTLGLMLRVNLLKSRLQVGASIDMYSKRRSTWLNNLNVPFSICLTYNRI